MITHEQIVHLFGKRLNFALIGGRVVGVSKGNQPKDAVIAWRLDVTPNLSDEGLTDRGVLVVGALGIICLINHVVEHGRPTESGKVIMDRLLRLFPGSAFAPEMIKATIAAALEQPGLGGEGNYFTACALRQMQDWSTDSVEVEVTGLPKITDH